MNILCDMVRILEIVKHNHPLRPTSRFWQLRFISCLPALSFNKLIWPVRFELAPLPDGSLAQLTYDISKLHSNRIPCMCFAYFCFLTKTTLLFIDDQRTISPPSMLLNFSLFHSVLHLVHIFLTIYSLCILCFYYTFSKRDHFIPTKEC